MCHRRRVSDGEDPRIARGGLVAPRDAAAPAGADAVIPPRGSGIASRLRLALLKARSRGRLEAGRGVHVARGARVDATAGVRLGDGCLLGPGCRIEAAAGHVDIGPHARLGERSVLVALAGIFVGEDAVVGEWAVLSDAFPDAPDVERPVRLQALHALPIHVGARARIGAHAALGAGARIAPGDVVASYAVVPTPAAPPTSP
jgi:acetyltransferase-like isoleucine patch superfamily enzyme